ncbi:MAG: tetratricopeptide repeat protein [Pirellulaceae bacterium]|nr:tetratricopeptide repeat protein [Pirellulaceae bacterium]
MTSLAQDAKQIFLAAVEQHTPDQWPKFLDDATRGDAALRQHVEALLAAHQQANQLLDRTGLVATLAPAPSTERPGTQIGPYQLVEQLGDGGMGIVYRASQHEPIQREVALKIIKPGMDTREVLARFQAEEQALALMDHPHVAKVLDAGRTESGRPYFVMELVHGVTITQYCDDRHLSTRERLELFVQVCHAVQHAHQKGIIHRDLKPSNILVTLHDGAAVPKIIDFGVAKAINQELLTQTLATNAGQLIGTPLYMSPEQAEPSGRDIDTRSDIYSLGAVLYELLTGTTPFDRDRLRAAGLDEMRRLIREQEPPRPSTRISTMGQAATTVSEHRRTNPVELSNALRHELDWIVMKALEKDRTRRYQTANDFARDIERYLHDEAVEARPPSTAYRFRKFARRNRLTLAATSMVVLSLLAVLIAFSLFSRAAREAAEIRSERTERRLRVQQGVNKALAEVNRLRVSASIAEQRSEAVLTAAREQLQLALGLAAGGPTDPELMAPLRSLEQELEDERAVLAQDRRDRDLLKTLEAAWLLQANVDVSESRFAKEDSIPLLRKALQEYGIRVLDMPAADVAAIVTSRPPEVRQHLLAAMEEWGALARPIIGVALQTADGRTVITGIAPDSPAARDGRLREGDTLVGVGEGREGEIVNIESSAGPAVKKLLVGESGTTVRLEIIPTGATESRVYEIQRDPTAAWLQAVVETADSDPWRCRLRKALKLEDPAKQVEALTQLAEQVDVQNQPARVLTRLAVQLEVLGDRLGVLDARNLATALSRRVQKAYPSDLWANANLADALRQCRPPQVEEAIRYYTAAIALRPESAGLHLNLAVALHELGRQDEAIAEYRESLRIAPFYAAPRCSLVDILIEMGKEAEAEAVAREAVQRWPQAATYANLGRALRKLGKNEDASVAYREALRLDPRLVDGHSQMAMELFGTGRKDEALEKFREVVAMNPSDARSHYNLGLALQLLERTDEACEAYRASLKLDPNLVAALTNLTNVLQRQGRAEEAVQVCREVLARKPDSAEMHASLGVCLWVNDREEEAIAAFRESIRLYPRPNPLNLAYLNLSELLATSQNPAVRNVEEAIALASQAVEMAPQEELAWEALGIARFHNEDWQAAIEAFQKSESFVDPRKYGTLYTHSTLSWSENHLYRAMAYWQLGQTDDARACFVVGKSEFDQSGRGLTSDVLQEAANLLGMNLDEPPSTQETIAAYRATLATDPAGAIRQNELAWLLATTPDVQYREPAQAVQHGLEAVRLMPQDADAWNTLGVAHYRNGQWNEAIDALNKSMERSGGTAIDWLFLAMTHWQRGERDEARTWYDRAATWMQDQADEALTEELTRFRAEADELLGTEKAAREQFNVGDHEGSAADAPIGNVPAIPPNQP